MVLRISYRTAICASTLSMATLGSSLMGIFIIVKQSEVSNLLHTLYTEPRGLTGFWISFQGPDAEELKIAMPHF